MLYLMSQFVLISDPKIMDIPVADCGEPLVDLRTALRVDTRLADGDGSFAKVRSSVADRLVSAQTLLPRGFRLLIVEGYRPLSLQAKYFDAHVERLRQAQPLRDDGWLRSRASMYISPTDVAPHVAGAAVDLTLCTVDGTELWMGTEVNDTETGLCHTASPGIPMKARSHRRLLAEALEAAGLINYPTEWWHWSYGDRYWAYHTGAIAARYGPITD